MEGVGSEEPALRKCFASMSCFQCLLSSISKIDERKKEEITQARRKLFELALSNEAK